MKVLVAGFGSIGRRHTKNILNLRIVPYVLTEYPDQGVEVTFVSRIEELEAEGITHAVICSPTTRHLDDFNKLASAGIKNFLVEKPLEKNIERATRIFSAASAHNLDAYVAYNMRFLPAFGIIRDFVKENLFSIRIVDISAGYYLPLWRPGRNYQDSYSADSKRGGGVDLDLSHEIDYMLWIFGQPQTQKIVKARMSSLKIDSPDVFLGIYQYNSDDRSFVVRIELDYIRRQKDRCIKIICENGNVLFCDFVNKKLELSGGTENKKEVIADEKLFDFDESYIQEIKEFLAIKPVSEKKLATVDESIKVLSLLRES